MRAFVVLVWLGLHAAQSALVRSTTSESWNSLLHTKSIFPAELDAIPSGGAGLTGAGAAKEVTQLLTQVLERPGLLSEIYGNYLSEFGKIEEPLRKPGKTSRLEAFRAALFQVAAHNAEAHNGEHSWTMAINKFADWTPEEMHLQPTKRPTLSAPTSFNELPNVAKYLKALADAPSTKDYRAEGVVSPVKDQGVGCIGGGGCCYAFAAVAAAESAHAIKTGEILDLAELEIVDCAKGQGINNGCDGGDAYCSYPYMTNGLVLESDYPFVGTKDGADRVCASSLTGKTRYARVASGDYIRNTTEDNLQAILLADGPVPVSVAVDVAGWSQYRYDKGVYTGACAESVNHAIVAVGYTEDAWIIKNSWGSDWGENGYIRLQRGVNKCLVAYELEPITGMK